MPWMPTACPGRPLIQFKADGVLMFQVGDARLPGQTDSWRLLATGHGTRPRCRRRHPSGLPAFPIVVGVNADDDLLPLAGARPRCRPIPPPTSASMPRPTWPVSTARRTISGTEVWLRLAVPSDSERSQEHPLQRPRIHRRNGQGEGTTRPTAGAPGAAHQRNTRVLVAETWSHRRQLPIRTAGPGAAIHGSAATTSRCTAP